MKLPDQAIREFQAAWLASFGEDISPERAEMEANALLQLHVIITTNLTQK